MKRRLLLLYGRDRNFDRVLTKPFWDGSRRSHRNLKIQSERKILMKTSQADSNVEESTYALLVRSEDKMRALVETIVYGLIILSALAAILQFAGQPVLFSA
jgi:hypothetical protein